MSFGPVHCNAIRTSSTFALVYGFPYEGCNDLIKAALSEFGDVRSVDHQKWGFCAVYSGTRKVRIVHKNVHILRFVNIDGIRCKVWHKEQPVECDICKAAHIASVCPLCGKCTRCHQEGHVRRECTFLAWQSPPPPVVGSASADPTPADSLPMSDLRDNELSPPSQPGDFAVDSSCAGEAPGEPLGDAGAALPVNDNVSVVLPSVDNASLSSETVASDGSSSLPLSVDPPAITTEVLEEDFVSRSGSQGGGVGSTEASPPSPDAL